ncbi:MAG TPA: TerB family tellurite resistance protein [Polyangiaceae bacterium]|nr:TerB family tellurite resistance protein [Polyangiaceae bacterium]
MDVSGLSDAEHTVLLALVGLLARADGRLSQTEMSTLEQLRSVITPERFQKIRDEAAALGDDEAILNAARAVTRPEAREVIFGVLYEMAIPDVIDPSELAILEHVASLWGLEAPLPD